MDTTITQYALAAWAPPTHLAPQETPVETEGAEPLPTSLRLPLTLTDTFRHSGWRADRQRIFDALQRNRSPWRRLQAFAECGSSCWILHSTAQTDLYRVVPDYCHDRFCVPCGGSRRATIRRNLEANLSRQPHRMLTLTVRSADEPLAELVRRLYTAFRRLRQRALWKERVRGGVAFLEITYNPDRRSWHPHLHAILEGGYIDLQLLIREWLSCTGDSHNVKINRIRSRTETILYVTKYATKPLPSVVIHQPDALDEAIRMLHARRTVLCLGTWRHWKLLSNPEDEGWELYEHLNAVRFDAANGNPLAENILAMLTSADPATGEFIVHVEAPEPVDGPDPDW